MSGAVRGIVLQIIIYIKIQVFFCDDPPVHYCPNLQAVACENVFLHPYGPFNTSRRDKYQKNLKEYYVETGTQIDFQEGWDESVQQKFTAEPEEISGVLRGVDGPGPSMGSDREDVQSIEDEREEGSQSETESQVDSDSEREDTRKRPKPNHGLKEEPADEENCSQKHSKDMIHTHIYIYILTYIYIYIYMHTFDAFRISNGKAFNQS